jgi:putative transposase
MLRNRLRRGMHIEFGGREYVIGSRLPSGEVQIKDLTTDNIRNIPEMEIIAALFEGHFAFLGEGRNGTLLEQKNIKKLIDDIVMLRDDDLRKKEAKRRYAYLKRIQGSNLSQFTKDTLDPLLREVAEEIGETAPNWKTVYYRWFRRFIASGEDIRVLVPSYKSRGNRRPKFAGSRKGKGEKFSQREKDKAKEIAEVVKDIIDEEYMNEQRLTVHAVYDSLVQRIAEINQFRDSEDRLPIPDRSSLYDRVNNLDEYEADSARFGKKYADHKHRSNQLGPRPTRPLERVEIDHTTLDLFVLDDELRLPVGRPTITAAIDKYSRMILGIYVSFDSTGYASVMQCLLHAITPKTYLKVQFPSIENSWNTYGLPEVLVVDNGPEFYSKDFRDACRQLGIVDMYNPPKNPHYKASIERYFGTMNRRLLHRQPGTTFSNILDKKDYDPKKNALISFGAFMEMLHIWIVDVYHQSIHKGLKDIPAHAWNEGVLKYPPALPRRKADLRILLGKIEYRTMGPSGIQLYTLLYNCEELTSLRQESEDEKVALKLNPEDLSIIYVYDRKNDRYIPVPAVDQEYTKGLSLWQHEVIKNYAHKLVGERLDSDALLRAKKRIQEIVDEEWAKPHRSGPRSKMARWKGIRQRNAPIAQRMEAGQPKSMHEQIETDDALLRLDCGDSPWKGLSDIGELEVHGQAGTGFNFDRPIAHEHEPSSENSKVMIPSRRCITDDTRLNAKESAKDERPASPDAEALDMTGYSSSFGLPQRET